MKARATLTTDKRTITVHVPLRLSRRGGRKLVVSPEGVIGVPARARIDNPLVKALARAHRWQKLLENGTHASVADIAKAERINDSYVARVLRLTLLAPEIIESLLDGRHPPELQTDALLKPMPVEWPRQKATIAKLAQQDYDR